MENAKLTPYHHAFGRTDVFNGQNESAGTCWDRNRLAWQADLLAAASLGIRNVLAVTADHNLLGDHHAAKRFLILTIVQL